MFVFENAKFSPKESSWLHFAPDGFVSGCPGLCRRYV